MGHVNNQTVMRIAQARHGARQRIEKKKTQKPAMSPFLKRNRIPLETKVRNSIARCLLPCLLGCNHNKSSNAALDWFLQLVIGCQAIDAPPLLKQLDHGT